MEKRAKICLVCSPGGHFFELNSLKKFWEQREHFWITFHSSDTEYLLKNEKIYWAYSPTNRNLINLFKNFLLAIRILKEEKPDILLTSGAGVGVPFIYVAKLFKIKTIYSESLTRIRDISLSGKLVYHFVDHFLVQWPELTEKYKKAEFIATNI